MYDIMRYENEFGTAVNFLADPDPDGFIAVTRLEHTLNPRSQRRGKSEEHGSWPSFTYYESLQIVLEGSIQAASSTQYNNFVTNIQQMMMPAPLTRPTERTPGTFVIRKAGFTAIWEIPVTIDVPFQTPQEAGSPSRTEFHLQLLAFRPFYYEPKTNQYYWPS